MAGFQPKPEDLDYPNKLQRMAEQPDSAVPDSQAEQLPLMTDNGNGSPAQDSTVSPHQSFHRSVLVYAAFTKESLQNWEQPYPGI